MFKHTLLAAATVAALGAGGASAEHYNYGGWSRSYGYSSADRFAREAARDGRVTKDEQRIINALRAQEAQRYYRPRYVAPPPPQRYYRYW